MGDTIGGGTVYWLDDRVDGGLIERQDWSFVRRTDTAASLWRRDLVPMGVCLLKEAVADVARGVINRRSPEEAGATWEPALKRPPLTSERGGS